MKILSVIDTAYRGTLEEQDDAALWFNHACRNSGSDISILLTGNAVNYAVKAQNPDILSFGGGGVPHPSKFHEDLKTMVSHGATVYIMTDDLEERGISSDELIAETEGVRRTGLADLLVHFDHIWHW